MPRARKDCPICGKEGLLKLSNHLADFHQLSCEAREQYLIQARLNLSGKDKEMTIPGEGLDIKKTLESIVKRQENMEENLKKYLIVAGERSEKCDSIKPKRQPKSSIMKKKRSCMVKADTGSIKWLTF